VEGDSTASSSVAEIATQSHIVNAYLEDERTIVVKLSNALTLPFSADYVLVTNLATGATLAATDVDIVQTQQVVLVGDLQHMLGAEGNWSPTDRTTLMTRVNANLYQFTGMLPAGVYNYKVAFDGTFDGALPYANAVLVVPEGGAKVTFSYVPYDAITRQRETYDSINTPYISFPTSTDGVQTDLVAVKLADAVNVVDTLVITLRGHGQNSVVPRNVLSESVYLYTGDDLGSVYTPESTAFRLWAPTASDVQVLLYESELGGLTRQVAMQKSEQGTWCVQVQGDLGNWYYLYLLTLHGVTQTAVDPYARAISVNGLRGMIVDLARTHPDDWDTDRYKALVHAVDAVIYELHVRDFSIEQHSGMTHRGQYLAFTERETQGLDGVVTGVDSLTQLGISHVQLLPVEEFASVDENAPDQYNWGYDPRNYNVPEGAYATTPHGTARIREFKQLVQSLHKANIGVIMDVVYNHTYVTVNSDFNKIVPQYYYRTDYAGKFTNGSGVGNELATERPMVQKFVRDSLKYWVQQYHVDGFRFDLMALLGVETMRKVVEDLHALNPNVLLYGEPWTGGGSALPGGQLVTKGQQRRRGFGVFNDDMRNALVGSMFDAHNQGFPTGAGGQVGSIEAGVMGSINSFTAAPGETVNYATSHDNYTLWDKIALSNGGEPEYDRILMDQLVQAIVLTSQGVPFLQGGDEFLRTKGGNDNSYNAGDAVNQFVWERKSQYKNVFNYYACLIHLRNNHPAFRMSSAEDVWEHLSFLNSPDNTVAFQMTEYANGDPWKNIVVIYNPNKANVVVSLPEGSWTIVGTQGHVGETSLGQAAGTIVVPGIACEILYQN